MTEYEKLPLSTKIFGPIFLLVLTFIFIELFIGSSGLLLTGIINQDEIIIFGKSDMYLLGSGLLIVPFAILSFITTIKRKILDVNRTVGKYMLIIPMIVLFTFPHIADYAVSSYMKKINYVYCQEQSILEIMTTQHAYAKDRNTCLKVTKDMFNVYTFWNKYFDDKR